MPRRTGVTVVRVALLLAALLISACSTGVGPPDVVTPGAPGEQEASPSQSGAQAADADESGQDEADGPEPPSGNRGTLTLAFAGDVHFEGGLSALPTRPNATLGPLSRHLRSADLAMVNLESALTRGGGRRTGKELEDPSRRYWFRAPPAALRVLERSGVDVTTIANNHGADFGAAGLRESLAVADKGPIPVIGVGRDAEEAFAPHRVTVKGTDVAVFAADAMFRESDDPIWAAGEGGPGIASAREPRPRRLLSAVRRAEARGDLVVVYLHWGRSLQECPTDKQRRLARQLSSAGTDVVVGTAAHVLLGAGMLEDTYVSYGLGNFLWYHGSQSRSGVLRVRVTDGRVVADDFVPARIPPGGGQPRGLGPDRRSQAVSEWEDLRGCTGLEPIGEAGGGGGRDAGGADAGDDGGSSGGGQVGQRAELPPYEADVRRIGPALRQRMSSSHDPDRCPVALADLRHLRMSYVGFDGLRHTGEMVVNAAHADDVVGVFAELYDARWPIRRMELVDEYDGNDNRSMAANNTSAYNCRRVAGQDTWSAHAYGAAIDINPVQNPYVTGGDILPPRGRRFADVDRSAGAETEPGVIRRGDVVMQAFERLGWTWGGTWSQPDYQHFTAR